MLDVVVMWHWASGSSLAPLALIGAPPRGVVNADSERSDTSYVDAGSYPAVSVFWGLSLGQPLVPSCLESPLSPLPGQAHLRHLPGPPHA